MNVTNVLLGIAIFFMCVFAVMLVLPVLMKAFTALEAKFTGTTPAPTTGPAFVFTANPFAFFALKLAGMHKSWTIWFNALIAGLLPMLDYAQTNVTALQPFIPQNFYAYAMIGIILGNIVLRFKTFNSLAEKVTPNVQPPTA